MDNSRLGQQMRSGALWNYLGGMLGSIIQFGSGILLARLLQPSDFGLFFAVTAYTAILSSQIKFGVPEALLQATKLMEEQWNTAFWIMEGIALLAILIVVVGAPFLADFYGDTRYANIAYLLAISFPVIPFMSINGTLLRRRMDFKTAALIQLQAAFLGTGMSVVTAFLGFGPYCFVAGGLAGTLLSSYLMAKAAPWHPRIHFSLSPFKSLFEYAWRIHLNNSIFLFTSRTDSMIMGKLASLSGLGLFMRAKSLAFLPKEKICSPIYQLAFSGFSRIQENMDHSIGMYQKILCATTSSIYPILLLFLFTGDALIFFLYGEKWLASAPMLKVLTIGVFFSVITTMTSTLAEAQNLVARQTPLEIINLFLTVVAIFLGYHMGGLMGIATGITIKIIVNQLLMLRLIQQSHIDISLRQLFKALRPALFSTLLAGIVGLSVMQLLHASGIGNTSLAYLTVMGAAIALSYAASWYWLALRNPQDPILSSNFELARQLFFRFRALPTGKRST